MEPCIESLNNGDCFILVAGSRLFLLLGEHANIIEKTKANEAYDWIRLQRDLGLNKRQITCAIIDCRTSLIFKSESCLSDTEQEFLQALKEKNSNSDVDIEKFQYSHRDETYEQSINETNMVYRVRGLSNDDQCNSDESDEYDELSKHCLEPVSHYCHNVLSYNMLDEDQVFVFDFGTEFYIWNGRNASQARKKAALSLGKQLFDMGYDYSTLKLTRLNGKLPRPAWTLFGKQTQNAETILFRSKFIDWPNQQNSPSLKKIGYNGSLKTCVPIESGHHSMGKENSAGLFNFEPLSKEKIRQLNEESPPVNLVLENTNLGRGTHWHDRVENRQFDIVTENVTVWQIINNELVELDRSSYGEFVSNLTYVIKWQYKVNAVGFRTLKGQASQHQGVTGRDRFVLFFWQGDSSSRSEKGCSALLSLDNLAASIGSNFEVDSLTGAVPTERTLPHVQVNQYREIAAFCQLFNGSMVILNGPCVTTESWRMFQLRGELEKESHLIEVKQVRREGLRSRTSFLFLNSNSGKVLIWHGFFSTHVQQELIRKLTQNFMKR